MIDKIKWTATFFVILATALNSLGYYPIGPIVNAFAAMLWLVVAVAWKDKALIVTNFTIAVVCAIGLVISLGVL